MIEAAGHALVSWLVAVNASTVALLCGALLLDRALARRARASLRIALYAPVALRVLLPPSWTVPVENVPNVATVLPIDALASSAQPAAHAGITWYAAVAIAYVVVAAGLALRALAHRARLARDVASATTAISVDAPCPVVRHPELGPMVVGLVAPRIVLPDAMIEGASPDAMACVIKHEIAHVERKDAWLTAAMQLLVIAFWPVVPLWIAASRVRHLIELACDEAALASADAAERRRYGHVLLDVAEQQSMALAAAGSLQFGSTLRARIEAIALHRPWPRAAQASVVLVAVLGFAACASTGPAATPAPSARTAASDDYGYLFDEDSSKQAAPQASSTPPTTKTAEGRLAPEAIQGVVRARFGRFRTCYQDALAKDAKLQGQVAVAFVIAPDGSVKSAEDHGSTMPDAKVVGCVVDGFRDLSFPAPEGGSVAVVYPLVFSPGD